MSNNMKKTISKKTKCEVIRWNTEAPEDAAVAAEFREFAKKQGRPVGELFVQALKEFTERGEAERSHQKAIIDQCQAVQEKFHLSPEYLRDDILSGAVDFEGVAHFGPGDVESVEEGEGLFMSSAGDLLLSAEHRNLRSMTLRESAQWFRDKFKYGFADFTWSDRMMGDWLGRIVGAME